MLWISYSALGRRVKTKKRSTATSSSGGAGAQIHKLQGVHFCQMGLKAPTKAHLCTLLHLPGEGRQVRFPTYRVLCANPKWHRRRGGQWGQLGSSGAPWLRSVRFRKDSIKKIIDFELGSSLAQIGPFPSGFS